MELVDRPFPILDKLIGIFFNAEVLQKRFIEDQAVRAVEGQQRKVAGREIQLARDRNVFGAAVVPIIGFKADLLVVIVQIQKQAVGRKLCGVVEIRHGNVVQHAAAEMVVLEQVGHRA